MLAGGDEERQPGVEEDGVGGMSLGIHKSPVESRWCVGRSRQLPRRGTSDKGMLGHSLGLTEVIKEGRRGCKEGG